MHHRKSPPRQSGRRYQAARLGDARHLEFGGSGRDMRIETGCRRGDEIDR
jgi:hypothetical protein